MEKLILVSNPGSASRKYALYRGKTCLAKLHFEHESEAVICTLETGGKKERVDTNLSHLSFAASQLADVLVDHKIITGAKPIKRVALRVVAPSVYFQKDRQLNKLTLAKLAELEPVVPLHINATLQEASLLAKYFPQAQLVGISDSAFHATMPELASRYGLPKNDADRLGLKRFGYQGLSVESVVKTLRATKKLAARTIVCHLGSGSSVTALASGRSIDTTMGYSPLEGLMMSTRSGNLDIAAALALQEELGLKGDSLLEYLNEKSGLLGVSGKSSDIRELLKLESDEPAAKLALDMYVYRVQACIGQMAAVLGGIDALVFTGTVGERSSPIRQRIVHKLMFLGLAIDPAKNHVSVEPGELTQISPPHFPAKIFIVPANEDSVMAVRGQAYKLK